ncbi:MAG: hypothetical protein RLZZ480_389 [Candidatus Parcubacteria bacterium]|jgi:hypothetical protein
MIEELKLAYLERDLTGEAREQLKQIEVALRALTHEGRDETEIEDCTHVLTLCHEWITELEAHDVPDKHPVLESVREYMRKFLPTYRKVYQEKSQELMEMADIE